MKQSTTDIHHNLKTLGRALGLFADGEVSNSLLRVRLSDDAAYRPRVDVLWSLLLRKEQRGAVAWALGLDVRDVTHLPIIGIEVEATTPTTKTIEADIANICALGSPFGMLVVTEAGEKNIYRRAARAIRSVRRAFGDIKVVPVEAGWLPKLVETNWPEGDSPPPITAKKSPTGGECPEWNVPTRGELRRRGEQAGFVVVEPYIPPIVAQTFSHASSNWKQPLRETIDPISGNREDFARAAKYLTESKIDMAWLMPLPKAVSCFLQNLVQLDPCMTEHGMLFPDLWTHISVVAFELETSASKHAGGALLNLATHSILGVVVTRTDNIAHAVTAMLKTYQPTLGLRNVFVRPMP